MATGIFDLDLEVVSAHAPSPAEIAANPLAAHELEQRLHCTTPTLNTYTFGLARCPLCCD